jgi:hypothetical protein
MLVSSCCIADIYLEFGSQLRNYDTVIIDLSYMP